MQSDKRKTEQCITTKTKTTQPPQNKIKFSSLIISLQTEV